MADRSELPLGKIIAGVVVGMLVLGASVVAGVNFAVDRAVSADARVRAEDWARYFIGTLPNLDDMLAKAALSDDDTRIVSTAAKVGNVFRFKLYDPKGRTIIQSDADEDFGKTADHDDGDHFDDEIGGVVESHEAEISLNDGSQERDMPALYAEAYLPVLAANGSLRAVVETYLDETKTAAFFKTSFATLAAVLGAGMALAFGIPTLAFLIRSRQAAEVRHRAEFLASHDPLTSLLNRTSFAELLDERIASKPEGQELAVAFLDIDELKTTNAAFGHEGGNALIKHAAMAINALCLPGEFVARAGGDEFFVALTRPDAAAITGVVEAIAAAIREPFDFNGARISGRVSTGIYVVDKVDAAEGALHRADVALYQAKTEGKNVARLFSPEVERRMRGRRDIEQLVRDAVANSRFELHYQPQFDAVSRQCIAFEALLRLRNDAGQPVPPMTFIPVAEELGLIDTIGRWVIEEATQTAAAWPASIIIGVNLSVRQFASGTLVADIERALAAAGLPPSRLELEVTESLLMENTAAVAQQLEALKAMGVSIAMDDFGTGFSSLGYLWQFGFDKLKIDRSFVSALDVGEAKAREILDTIVMLAHKLGMKVTAEGIETERQAAILNALGCDQFQGFLLGKPAPTTAIAPHLLAGPAELKAAG